MIKAIIFDLDGVLVDTKNIHFEALNLALKNTEVCPAVFEIFEQIKTQPK